MKTPILEKEYIVKINESGGNELTASVSYKQVSNCMKQIGYFGAAAFFSKEADDEIAHYQVWADAANDFGFILEIPSVKPKEKPMGLKEAFDFYYRNEKELFDFYNNFYSECDDPALHQVLLQFIEIQRKSVGEAGDFLATLEQCDDKASLLVFDKELNG